MVCPLICEQMGKRVDDCGSNRSGARRRWSTAEKQRIVEESLAPAASVVEVARRYDVLPNLLTVWRRQARTSAFVYEPEPATGRDDEVHFAAVAAYSYMDRRVIDADATLGH